jgi:phage virion morphogenesis protein
MAYSFNIDLSELVEVQKYLEKLDLSENKKQELLANIGTVVVFQTRDRFKSKQNPTGLKWAPWSKEYAKTRHNGHSLLENEGYLEQSIVYKVSGNTVEIGSDEVYAGTHQYGHKGIPARPYLGINQQNKKEIEREIIEYLKGMF